MNVRAEASPVAFPVLALASSYGGEVAPVDAWELHSTGQATLIDVRTVEERSYVGRIPGAAHVAWATGTAMSRNPHFVRQVQALIPDRFANLLLVCRSGKRSAAAAEALTKAGYSRAFSVSEGFEGELDAEGHRGKADGWRFRGLPWLQD
jgi:rhodanese-related sulfurtransferase